MPRKVAIIGMSPSRMNAPWGDDSWDRWCLAWDKMAFNNSKRPYPTTGPERLFEIHSPDKWGRHHKGKPQQVSYRQALAELKVPVYMQEAYEDIPASVAYPMEAVLERIGGRDYFGSSIAYMLALALYENVKKVGVWGVELSQTDYAHQRPNIEYLCGRLEESGCDLTFAENNPRGCVLRLEPQPYSDGVRWKRYGWIREDVA